MECHSCRAAKVAMSATIAMGMMPQKTYSAQNCHPATLQNRRPIEPTILSAVMMYGKCFTLKMEDYQITTKDSHPYLNFMLRL